MLPRSVEFTGLSTGEERSTQREESAVSSQQCIDEHVHVRKLPEARERNIEKDYREQCPAHTQEGEECQIGKSQDTSIWGLEESTGRVLLQKWGIIRLNLNLAPLSSNTS